MSGAAELRELENDWDSYGTVKPSEAAIAAVEEFMARVKFIPCPDGATCGAGVFWRLRTAPYETIAVVFNAAGELVGARLNGDVAPNPVP